MSENEQISPVTEVEETRPISAEKNTQSNELKAEKTVAKNKKEKKTKKSVDKKPSKIKTALKETKSELKKVTWPKFAQVAKQTGVVILVTLLFLVVVFGIDRLCSWLVGFIV